MPSEKRKEGKEGMERGREGGTKEIKEKEKEGKKEKEKERFFILHRNLCLITASLTISKVISNQ